MSAHTHATAMHALRIALAVLLGLCALAWPNESLFALLALAAAVVIWHRPHDPHDASTRRA